jgi:hypothetical protein
VSKARLIITAVIIEGRSQAQVARDCAPGMLTVVDDRLARAGRACLGERA